MKPRSLTHNLRTAVLLAAVSLALAGCEINYGFGRSARLDTLPPADCTERVLRETPAITSVTRIDPATGAELEQLDHSRDGNSYIFKFHGAAESHIAGSVWFEKRRSRVYFSDGDGAMNHPPPQLEIDATRLLMPKIEAELAHQCGATQLLTDVRERCYRVECKALSE
jgi:hypothetical protein